jgi:hypothetical protein
MLDSMVLDEGLLRQARESGAALADATHQVEVAKANYHHAVRRLHFAGASMREIADALEISHQRVHQIIEATGGTGGWKARKRRHATGLNCSFCGRSKDDVAKLIAGPGIYICDQCVALAHRAADGLPAAGFDVVAKVSEWKCSFCGKKAAHVGILLAGPGLYICDRCLVVCDEVLAAAST